MNNNHLANYYEFDKNCEIKSCTVNILLSNNDLSLFTNRIPKIIYCFKLSYLLTTNVLIKDCKSFCWHWTQKIWNRNVYYDGNYSCGFMGADIWIDISYLQ